MARADLVEPALGGRDGLSMASALVILCAAVLVWLAWTRINNATLNDFFSPFNLLLYFWILPLIVSYMQLSDLQTGLSAQATLLILSCTIVLFSTTLLPMLTLKDRSPAVGSYAAVGLLQRRRWLIIAFYFATLCAVYFAEFYSMDVPLLAYMAMEAASSTLHTAGKESKLQVLAFGVHVATMFVFVLALNSRRALAKSALICMVLVVVIVGVLKAAKTDVYMPILVCSALYYYHRRRSGERLPFWWKILGIFVLLLLVWVTVIRIQGVGVQGGYAEAIQFKYGDELGPVWSEIVSILYGYTSLGFQNLSNYMSIGDNELRIGTSMFRPILSMLMQGDVAQSLDVPVERWGVVTDAANTGTYLTPLYIESGPGGCLLASAVYGVLVNAFYIRFRRRGGMWMFLYVSMIFPWTWLFFTNAFSVLAMYTNLFYVILFFLAWRTRKSVAIRAHALIKHLAPRRGAPAGDA